ncbi:hypothetical protein DMH25_40985 [Streptomyces sp. WAC 01325]|uniref:hypothetical protein n=1 Tax=Streptomyces sp. WAC 01325 TaxID=2203202 RepID=UPI000F87857B|nr:hypothetical protein DMH25_40985 [Streptomyces sp. WAC 01325]
MIRIAFKRAIKSRCRYKVGAALVSGNRILAASANLVRNNPTVDFMHATFHAEEAVLRKVSNARGVDIYVARVDGRGRPAMAKPCERCQAALRDAGIRRIYFTVDPVTVGKMLVV